MELLSAIQNVASLKKFMEEDFVSLLISIELNAVTNALSCLERAKDKKSVYWSAINHIEVIEEGLKNRLGTVNRFNVAKEYIFISSIKATIYKYLGEDGLVEKCYEDTISVVEMHNKNAKKHELLDVVSWWNPKNWFDTFSFGKTEIGRKSLGFDGKQFWEIMANKNGSLGLLVIDPDPGANGSYMYYK